MQRLVQPELLDELPAEDPRAICSRRDLSRLNVLMRNQATMAAALRAGANGHPPKHIIELGAGDGDFFLRVAQRLLATRSRSWPLNPPPAPPRRGADLQTRADSFPPWRGQGWVRSWRGVRITLVDRHSVASSITLTEFEKLGWRAESVVADVFDWAREASANTADVVVANLFLHHFAGAQLAGLFRAISIRARLFVGIEPRRAVWPLFCSRLLWAMGCNAITRHDAVVSVRAGFTGHELSALWPTGDAWTLAEKPVGLFSHLFIARRCD